MDWVQFIVFVLLVGYLAFLARLLGMAFGQSRKTACDSAGAARCLKRVLAGDRGDCDDDVLWHTQVPALAFLRSAGSAGVSVARMKEIYEEFARPYPEVGEGSNFLEWLDAMQSAAVAVRMGETIVITEKGRLVLDRVGQRQFSHDVPQSAAG